MDRGRGQGSCWMRWNRCQFNEIPIAEFGTDTSLEVWAINSCMVKLELTIHVEASKLGYLRGFCWFQNLLRFFKILYAIWKLLSCADFPKTSFLSNFPKTSWRRQNKCAGSGLPCITCAGGTEQPCYDQIPIAIISIDVGGWTFDSLWSFCHFRELDVTIDTMLSSFD